MDDHDDFDSVSWRREGESDTSRPTSDETSHTTLPTRISSGKQPSRSSHQEAQAGELAEPVDLAGIGDGILECTVGSPAKENDGTKDAYVSYLINTTTDFKSFQEPEFSIRRRFTDFVFLRNTLYREYPACAIPPLPEKNNMAYVRGDRFSVDFMQRRAWSLHRFIDRLTRHPVLRRAPIFILFLETQDWNAQMRLRPSRTSTSADGPGSPNSPSGFFDNMADTMLNAFSKVHKPDKRFLEVYERSAKLEEDLTNVEKVVARVARREADLETDYNDLAGNMRKLVTLEPAVEAEIQTFAACVEETSRGFKVLKDHTDQNYLGSLRDMQSYISSVQSLLKTRDQKQVDFEALTEYLQKAAAERDTLASSNPYSSQSSLNPASFIRNKMEDMRGVDHETAKQDRKRKLELRIQELTREVESARQTSEMFDEQVVREVSDFERIKQAEFRDTLGAFASSNAEFYQKVIDTWERFMADMEAEPSQPKDKGKI